MLLGVLKYPSSYEETVVESLYDRPAAGSPKWLFKTKKQKPPKCYHNCERDVVDWVLQPLTDGERKIFTQAHFQAEDKHKKPKHQSLDTSIMELADGIS